MSLWGCEELYVTGIPGNVSETEIRELFEEHGAVKEAVIVNKKAPAAPTAPQSCIVRMGNHADAVKAKKALHKHDWKGKQISVKWSHNQRVLWVGNLHDSVTNEVLQAAFSQFGAVSKTVVACDAPNNTSKGWGFVAFENKRFAVKAIENIRQRPFLVGAGPKPVIADWARNEEVMEGFSEEVRSGHKGQPPGPLLLENAARFPQPHSKEDMQGGRMLALRAEYDELRRLLKHRLAEAEEQILVTGNAPRLTQLLMSDPMLGPPGGYMGPPPPRGPMGMPQPPGPMGPPPPYGYPPAGGPPPGGLKRDAPESFHHVPPPSKRPGHGNQDRFNPNPNMQQRPEPPLGGPPPPPQRPGSGFVRGGELHTVNQGGEGGAPPQSAAAGSTAPPASGAKAPGSHDHGGIGFSGPVSSPGSSAPLGKAPAGAGSQQYDGSAGGRAPYASYQMSFNQPQHGAQPPGGPPPASGPGMYGAGAPPSYQPPQQQQYGTYGAAPAQPPQQQQYQQPPPASSYAPPPADQQPQQQYSYGSYNGYNYYQQGSAPQQQPAAPAPPGPPGQQQPYGAPPQQQQQQPMYGAPPQGQGYYS